MTAIPRLYHFSEDPGIAVFAPRSPIERPEVEPLVWAVDEAHAWTYLFPRDCPRILLWPLPATTPADRQRWLGRGGEGRVACVEWAWLERLHSIAVYRYQFPPTGFEPAPGEDADWMYVSREPVSPLAVDPVGDLVQALRVAGVELRLMPSLAPLRDAWDSTMHVSGIRLRNAIGWPSA
ncbi:MAG: hypothetical protein HY875_16560 [Chloroflexi bacterium]|nr:hypothetical protein [Chloroflexota bacterium]